MVTVSFTIPDTIVTEFNQIAVKAGFANAKQMVVAYLKAEIRANRGNTALVGIRETAEAQADTDTAGIN